MGSEQKNALFAVVLSGLILFGWQFYFSPPKTSAPVGPAVESTQPATTPVVEASTASGSIEPAIAETYKVTGNGVTLEFDSHLTVKNFENKQAAFSFENTVESKKPMSVEFDFGKGFQTLNFLPTGEANKFQNADYNIVVNVVPDVNGFPTFNIISANDFKYRFVYNIIHNDIRY